MGRPKYIYIQTTKTTVIWPRKQLQQTNIKERIGRCLHLI